MFGFPPPVVGCVGCVPGLPPGTRGFAGHLKVYFTGTIWEASVEAPPGPEVMSATLTFEISQPGVVPSHAIEKRFVPFPWPLWAIMRMVSRPVCEGFGGTPSVYTPT